MKKFFLLYCCLFSMLLGAYVQIDSTSIKDPNVAWKLSLIPRMGQLYNERHVKSTAFILAGTYAYLKRSEFSSTGQIGKRNTYTWWLFGLYVWGILDAYVDAHLFTYNIDDDLSLSIKPELIANNIGAGLISMKIKF